MNQMPMAFVWDGNAFVPCMAVPLIDRGFRYGMSLFESLAVRNGNVEFLDDHLARLDVACQRCGWPVGRGLLDRAGEMLATLPSPTFARLYVTAGDGDAADPVTAPRLFIFAEPRRVPEGRAIPVRLHPEPFLPPAGGLKTANYWANIAALRQAREVRCAEALLFNPNGELISACMANVFAEIDGVWVTPPAVCGVRRGVTREWVMQRRAVAERSMFPEDLKRASGCFLTSSWAGVTPVCELEGRPLATGFAERLRAEFFGA